ncbi:MAG: hypothetical protein ACYS76_01190, partial [Planctomycetota bacterium]
MKKPPIESSARVRNTAVLAVCLLALAAGCENNAKAPTSTEQIQSLRRDNKQLTRQLEQAEAANEQLQSQIKVLAGLPPGARTECLYRLQRVKITGYTNLYDKDKDRKKEKLVVYFQPIDEDGDIVKATGTVDVQLWDLNQADSEALLGEWHVTAEQLKKLWFATLITINYRLTFDVADKLD